MLVGTEISTTTTENSVWISQITKNELRYDPEISHLGIYQKEKKLVYQRDTCSIFTIAKKENQLKCLLADHRIKKMWCTIRTGILFSHNKEWNNIICSNMYGTEVIMLSIIKAIITQAKKYKYYMFSLICRSLKSWSHGGKE